MPFSCSICGEESTRICVRCTKDSCDNHLCEKCRKCSDCCECEVALTQHPPETVREALHAAVAQAEPAMMDAVAVLETPAEIPAPVAPVVEEAQSIGETIDTMTDGEPAPSVEETPAVATETIEQPGSEPAVESSESPINADERG